MARIYSTIGEVVDQLKPEFSDISISKIRFLENKGLIKPSRSKGGYRQFDEKELKKLQIILKLQKERFLPLSVIRSKITSLNEGELEELVLAEDIDVAKNEGFSLDEKSDKVPLKRAKAKVGLSEREIKNLSSYSLLDPQDSIDGKVVDELDVLIMEAVKTMSKFGIEPRHLKMFENFADREALLIYQIVAPLAKNRPKAEERITDIIRGSQNLKNLLLKKALLEVFKK